MQQQDIQLTHTLVYLFVFTHTSLYTPRPSLHPHPTVLSIFLVFFLEADSNGEKEKQAAISTPLGCIADSCHVCTRL